MSYQCSSPLKVLSKVFLYLFRHSILITNYIAISTGIFIFIPIWQVLLFFRISQGICIGVYSSIIPLYLREISPIHLSGTLCSFNQVLLAFGSFFGFFFTFILSSICKDPLHYNIWIYVFALPTLIAMTQTILLIFVYPY